MKRFLLFLALMLVAFVVVGQFLPSRVTVERSIVITRPATTVFTLLNGFRTWPEWSPWATMDPAAQFVRSGPDTGVGATLEWTGDPAVVGTGRQQIVSSEPFRSIELRTDMGPQGTATTRYTISGDRLGSRVTWSFETDVSEGQGPVGILVGRYFGLFLDRWVGEDFEKGLRALKSYAEALPDRDFSGADIALVEVTPTPVARVAGTSDTEPGAIASAMAAAYSEITAWALATGTVLGGQPMAITRAWDEPFIRFEAAIPLAESSAMTPAGDGRVEIGPSPSGLAARIVHRGPYEDTMASYERLYAWMAAHGYEQEGTSWEHYVSDPGETPAEELETHIYFLIEEPGD